MDDIRSVGPPRETLATVVDRGREHELLTYASAISFQTFFALIPLALFALGVLGVLHLQDVWRRDVGPDVRSGFSAPAFRVIDGTVREVLGRRQLVWATVGALIAMWEVSGAVRGIMGALNRIYGATDRRGLVRRFAVSIALSIAVSAAILSAVAVVKLGPLLVRDLVGPSVAVSVTAFLVRWLLAVALLLVAVGLLVRFAPARARPWEWVTFGALVAVGGWIAMSLIFAAYLTKLANYGTLFGNLATLIVVLEYVYLSSIAFLVGALVDGLTREHAEQNAGDR